MTSVGGCRVRAPSRHLLTRVARMLVLPIGNPDPIQLSNVAICTCKMHLIARKAPGISKL
jgi:hypothetical protein